VRKFKQYFTIPFHIFVFSLKTPVMNSTASKTGSLIAWIARAVGLVAIIFFLVFFVAKGYPFLRDELGLEAASVGFMIFSAVVGYIVGWFSELVGGIILVVGGGILAIYLMFLGGSYGLEGGMVYGLPFIVPGILFLIADASSGKSV